MPLHQPAPSCISYSLASFRRGAPPRRADGRPPRWTHPRITVEMSSWNTAPASVILTHPAAKSSSIGGPTHLCATSSRWSPVVAQKQVARIRKNRECSAFYGEVGHEVGKFPLQQPASLTPLRPVVVGQRPASSTGGGETPQLTQAAYSAWHPSGIRPF